MRHTSKTHGRHGKIAKLIGAAFAAVFAVSLPLGGVASADGGVNPTGESVPIKIEGPPCCK